MKTLHGLSRGAFASASRILAFSVHEKANSDTWYNAANDTIQTMPNHRGGQGASPLSQNSIPTWVQDFQKHETLIIQKPLQRAPMKGEDVPRISSSLVNTEKFSAQI